MPCVSANNAFYYKKELYKLGLLLSLYFIYEKIKHFRIFEAE